MQLTNTTLYEPCINISRLTPAIKRAARELLSTLQSMDNKAVGLAANQVGLKYHMFAVSGSRCNDSLNRAEDYVAVNCTILSSNDEVTFTSIEGCLSFPHNDYIPVQRVRSMLIQYQCGITGRWKRRIVTGLEAAVVQHELGHMRGQCVYDTVTA